MIEDRYLTYNKEHCWQYDIRVNNMEADLREANITEEEQKMLRTADFTYTLVTDKQEQKKMKAFIQRHEWLGTLSQYTTHWFGCYYKDKLAGVILFNMPNAFSKILGDNTKDIERLISRGACISWSPKNLASSFLMWCIKYMVQNTPYRLFTAYSDPTAKELGTIYQACNFYYMGQNAGASARYINPYTGTLTSDRYFRQKTAYKKYALELGIKWEAAWNHPTGMLWENVPDDIEIQLRQMSKDKQKNAKKIILPKKHKYAYVLGRNKKETKQLRKIYESKNKLREYPSER